MWNIQALQYNAMCNAGQDSTEKEKKNTENHFKVTYFKFGACLGIIKEFDAVTEMRLKF